MLRVRRTAWLVAAVSCLGVLSGCTVLDEPATGVVTLEAGPVLADEPLRLRVSDLEPGATVTVSVRGADQQAASADFVADSRGVVDLEEDAPASGSSYSEASGYGLLWQLAAGSGLGRVDVEVAVGDDVVGRATQDRVLAADDVRSQRLRPGLSGLSGHYFAPPRGAARRPGVVVMGGSEGGASATAEAQLLASRGYPALALAYFGEPGIPSRLRRVPVEYIANALAWLSIQPGVDPDRVVPYGISRGSEAALLVASLYPKLAAGAIAFAPNGVAVGDPTDSTQPAWTWKGRPVPWAQSRREWWIDPGEAVIDVWDIDGPLLFVCGAADQVWSSCSQTDDIVEQLAERGAPAPTVLAFEDVGHEIGYAPPGTGGAGRGAGRDLEATGLARAEAWDAVLDYLRDL